MPGNQKWIGGTNCYVCQRWQLTCFLFQPGDVRGGEDYALGKEHVACKETYRLSGSFVSLMMAYGKESWQSFRMMSALDFIKRHDHSFETPDEYMSGRLEGLDLPARKVDKLKEQLQHQYMSEYMQRFRAKFKQLLRTKDLPSQFNTVPSQCSLD